MTARRGASRDLEESERSQFNNPFKNSDAGMRFTLQKRPSRVPITALFLSTLSHHREFV